MHNSPSFASPSYMKSSFLPKTSSRERPDALMIEKGAIDTNLIIHYKLLIKHPVVQDKICLMSASVLLAAWFYYRKAQNLVKYICNISDFVL